VSYGNMKSGIQQYAQVGNQSGINGASPHRLIQMLMEGALGKISIAKGHMTRNEISQKGTTISWAISIIDGLRMSLDKEQGGDIAENLDALYEYMTNRLVQANIENSVDMLDEVAHLMITLKSGWDGIEKRVSDVPDAANQRPSVVSETVK